MTTQIPKKKKILAIQGSFRNHGKTSTMLDYAIGIAKDNGHDVTRINLFDMNIGYCKGCMKCDEAGECIFKTDDMPQITQMMRDADVIILAAPVYWGNVPAIVKNFFDRMRGASMEDTKTFPKPRLSGKKYILFTSCTTVMPFAKLCGQSSGLEHVVREYFKTAGVKKIGTVCCDNAKKYTEVPVKKLREIEKLMRKLG